MAISYTIAESDGAIGYQPISEISTTRKHKLGTRVKIVDNGNGYAGEAIYVAFKASTAVAAGIVMTWDTTAGVSGGAPFTPVAAVAATEKGVGGPVFVNLTAVSSSASVQYGWVLIEGIAPTLKTAVKVLASSVLTLSATAGRIYITSSGANQIVGARVVESSVTTTTSLVNVFYNRAHLQGAVA